MIQRGLLRTTVCLLCLVFHAYGQAPVAAPNFSAIGTRAESSLRLLEPPKSGVYPNQMSLDISTNGLIYGLICEYEGKQEIFESLKAQITKSLETPPRIVQTNLVVWRDEQRKFTVQLSYMRLPSEKDAKKIRIVGLSIDKEIRDK